MLSILSFLLTLLVIEVYYKIFVLKKNMKYNPNKVPTEVALLIKRYHIDIKKVNYYYLMKSIGRINALSVGVIIFVITFFDRMNIQFLLAIFLCIPVILISYSLFGRYLVKKGLTKDDKVLNKKKQQKIEKRKKGQVKK